MARWTCAVLMSIAVAACSDEVSLREPSVLALGAGSAGPVVTRVSPPRRRLRTTSDRPVRMAFRATDPQSDLSGADLYLDGELALQQHVGDVGGSGASAAFEATLTLAAGTHTVVAKAFDRHDHYSEGVTWVVDVAPRGRTVYVSHLLDDPDDPDGIRGLLDEAGTAEALLAFVADRGVDGVIFYGLGRVFAEARTDDLAALFERLAAAGVRELGAPIADGNGLDRVRAFNAAHPGRPFSLVVTEDEYWQSCDEPARGYRHECSSCRAACFPPFLALLASARGLANDEAAAGRSLTVAAYLGYPSSAEAEQITALVDRVLLNYHGASPAAAYERAYTRWGAMRARVHAFAGLGRAVEVWPIFYSCREANMHEWLETHTLDETEASFLARVSAEGAPLTDDVVIGGFAYYRQDGFADPGCP